MTENALRVAVIMERRTLANKWADHQWEAIGIVPSPEDAVAEPRKLFESTERTQWLFPGYELRLYADEAENYLLNITAPEPRVFVNWREDGESVRPAFVTVSYGEAARMMDAGEQVDGVSMPPELVEWVGAFARENYRPPEEKRKGKRFASQRGEGRK